MQQALRDCINRGSGCRNPAEESALQKTPEARAFDTKDQRTRRELKLLIQATVS